MRECQKAREEWISGAWGSDGGQRWKEGEKISERGSHRADDDHRDSINDNNKGVKTQLQGGQKTVAGGQNIVAGGFWKSGRAETVHVLVYDKMTE